MHTGNLGGQRTCCVHGVELQDCYQAVDACEEDAVAISTLDRAEKQRGHAQAAEQEHCYERDALGWPHLELPDLADGQK